MSKTNVPETLLSQAHSLLPNIAQIFQVFTGQREPIEREGYLLTLLLWVTARGIFTAVGEQ